MNSITNSKIIPGYISDHSIVTITINVTHLARGPGFFKMNNSVILQTEYQVKIKNSIREIADLNKNSNQNTLWEIIKGTVRNETIKYTTLKKS